MDNANEPARYHLGRGDLILAGTLVIHIVVTVTTLQNTDKRIDQKIAEMQRRQTLHETLPGHTDLQGRVITLEAERAANVRIADDIRGKLETLEARNRDLTFRIGSLEAHYENDQRDAHP